MREILNGHNINFGFYSEGGFDESLEGALAVNINRQGQKQGVQEAFKQFMLRQWVVERVVKRDVSCCIWFEDRITKIC